MLPARPEVMVCDIVSLNVYALLSLHGCENKTHLGPSKEEIAKLHTLPDIQGSYPLWSSKLVPDYSQHVNSQAFDIYSDLQRKQAANLATAAACLCSSFETTRL